MSFPGPQPWLVLERRQIEQSQHHVVDLFSIYAHAAPPRPPACHNLTPAEPSVPVSDNPVYRALSGSRAIACPLSRTIGPMPGFRMNAKDFTGSQQAGQLYL